MNAGVFILGFVLVVFGFISDIADYHDTYAMLFIIGGIILIVIGALIPSVITSTTHREAPVTTERKTRTVVKEE